MIRSHSSSVTYGSDLGTECPASSVSSSATSSSNSSEAQKVRNGGVNKSPFAFAKLMTDIESLPRLSSPTDHRAVPGLVVAATPRTGARDCLRGAWGAIRAGGRWLEESWLGDLLAILSLLGTCYLVLLAGWVLE